MLNSIKIRILVNGTRGKTSVTRWIAASFNAAGIKTVAKTTGSQARFILPDNSEVDYRKGKNPSMLEQRKFIKFALANKAEAIIVECMAITPENQSLMANTLIKQDYTLITNAYVDHIDEIGISKEETIKTLSKSIYKKSKVITSEKDFEKYHNIIICDGFDMNLPEFINDKADIENAKIVSALLKDMNLSQKYVIDGYLQLKNDIGMKKIFTYGKFKIINAFAANDTKSLVQIISSRMNDKPYILIYNHRNDRAFRLPMIINALKAIDKMPECVGVIGDSAKAVATYISDHIHVDAFAIDNPKNWLREQELRQSKQVLCVGNIKGKGIEFIESMGEEVRI